LEQPSLLLPSCDASLVLLLLLQLPSCASLVQLVLLPSCASLVLLSLLRPRTSPIGMVRIRHPNLFVDKRDINWAKMPTFCEKKFSACRKFIFIFFYAFAKILMFFIFGN
jgi:hypothetical protein